MDDERYFSVEWYDEVSGEWCLNASDDYLNSRSEVDEALNRLSANRTRIRETIISYN